MKKTGLTGIRQSLKESGYKLIMANGNGAVLEDKYGTREFWQQNDDYAGYVIEIFGIGYEYINNVTNRTA